MRKKYRMMGFLCFGLLLFNFLYFLNFLPHKIYTDKDFGIQTYISKKDQDRDGIDDQTDILIGAKAYIKTKPKYKSRYYQNGFPDDAYGVCTDVVAFAFLHAGYNLMDLVYEDMLQNKEDYVVKKIDKKIAFRRVQNLKIYLKHKAQSLTTDVTDIKEWQGGDIVVFKKHIGIVSDKRNRKGIPFLIHHARPYQMHYEEDVLAYRNDIIGHYRF